MTFAFLDFLQRFTVPQQLANFKLEIRVLA
jgi:hypothetical protein